MTVWTGRISQILLSSGSCLWIGFYKPDQSFLLWENHSMAQSGWYPSKIAALRSSFLSTHIPLFYQEMDSITLSLNLDKLCDRLQPIGLLGLIGLIWHKTDKQEKSKQILFTKILHVLGVTIGKWRSEEMAWRECLYTRLNKEWNCGKGTKIYGETKGRLELL